MFSPLESRFTKNELLAELTATCQWANISHGRAVQYASLIEHFFSGLGDSAEHVLACYEALDVVSVYHHWRDKVSTFPGLMRKLRRAINKGSLLEEQEKLDRAQSRDDLFVYLLAGRLLAAGVNVIAIESL